ncbi:hypothetical protein GGF46_003370 [Coemansia sp. RSA 552]|nr:hypothetical protein GGF46_003370 [Coemansia sp. RSA 552]
MRVTFSCVALALAFAAVSPANAFSAGRVAKRDGGAEYKPNSYLVHFHGDADDGHIAQLHVMPGVTVNHRFDSAVFHGVSVSTDGSINPNDIAATHGVKTVYYNGYTKLDYKREHVHSTSDALHEKTGVLRAAKELKLDGTGVKIGIIDTGVDYKHPDLGGCWKTKGCKWQFGLDLVSSGDGSAADADAIPVDCIGHGTHISGIIGATGDQVHGVAPGATLGMYRAFGCDEQASASDEIIIKAMEAAWKDGVDVINMSLGAGTYADKPAAVAASNLVANNVVVVAAAGNDGTSGLITVGAPSTAKGVISVGSVQGWKLNAPGLVFTSPTGSHEAYKTSSSYENYDKAKPEFIFEKDISAVAAKDSTGSTEGCNPFSASLEGKVALIDRGNCTFVEKIIFAQEAGAAGVIILLDEDMLAGLQVDETVKIPTASIMLRDTQAVRELLKQGSVMVRAPGLEPKDYSSFDTPTGGVMSPFSSYGPSAELDLRPVISAPGGYIWSTFLTTNGSYVSFSGTSQATPYITGAVALLKQHRPKLTANEIYNILVSTAKPLDDADTGMKVTPLWSGGGLVNIYDAVRSRALIDPPVISINDTAYETPIKSRKREAIRTVSIRNTDTRKALHASLYHSAANSVTMWNPDGTRVRIEIDGASVNTWPPYDIAVDPSTLPRIRASKLAVKIAPGRTANLSLIVSAPSGLEESERWFYSGFAVFSLQWDGENTRTSQTIPYTGFNGDFSKIDVLDIRDGVIPAILDTYQNPVDAADVRVSADTPYLFVFDQVMPSHHVAISLIDDKGRFAGYLPNGCGNDFSRTMVAQEIYKILSLDGQVQSTCGNNVETVNATAGRYHLRLEALRTFGNPDDPADYEVWESDQFVIE